MKINRESQPDETCPVCDGTGVVGVRTCHHTGNCPCGFDERECVCVLRGWAKAAIMGAIIGSRDLDFRETALELYRQIERGEADDWLNRIIERYDYLSKQRAARFN